MAGTTKQGGPGQGRGETGPEMQEGRQERDSAVVYRTAFAPSHPWAVAQLRFSVGKDLVSI
jgi:hypothetical protein